MRNSAGFLFLFLFLSSCDQGLEPVGHEVVADEGEIHAHITYVGEWPPEEEFHDLRFVAMRFIPESVNDFFRLSEMEISDLLETHVDQQTVILENVKNATFYYSGVAWRFSPNIFDWRVAGVYDENGGILTVQGDIVEIDVVVDFDNLPEFPPASQIQIPI